MARFWGSILCTFWIGGIACGGSPSGDLTIVWPSQEWSLSSGTTRSFVLGLDNLATAPLSMSCWQMYLEIAPDSGALGTVEFGDLRLPSNHVFADRSTDVDFYYENPSTPSVQTGLVTALVLYPPYNVPLLASGQSLLEVDLIASEDARGRFFVNALTGSSFDTAWFADTPEGGAATLNFDGIPINGLTRQSVEIGWVDVHPVPEPSTMILMSTAILVTAGYSWYRRGGLRKDSGLSDV